MFLLPIGVADLVYVETPAISLQSPSDACPIPGVPGQAFWVGKFQGKIPRFGLNLSGM